MINKVKNNWPLVPVQTPNGIALRKDSAVQSSPERRNELIIHDNRVPIKTSYSLEKGALIDIYA